ncbi:MAG: NAD(P)-dependent oxidoreductase, partial [Alphaproteobacteria bacterium]|nr:NAD(P)-dependent oxidoreductase [Alphaproteobacteria bacterium]
VTEIAGAAAVVLLSLPDGDASIAVARDIAAARPRRAGVVVDTSTIGIDAARSAAAALDAAGVAYVDAPVSGGVAGAEAGTLAMMIAAEAATVELLQPMLAAIAGNRFHVGATVGQGQAMKLLNNFLSGTAMAATAEAIAFGLDHGLDMKTMLDVLNASSGQNTATSDKYPRRVLTGTYDAGFATRLIAKDVALYERRVAASGARSAVGAAVREQWRRADAALPGSDFTRIFDYVRDSRRDR